MKTYESVLKQYFGFDTFRDNQLAIIKGIIEDKRDILGILFTGAGKSLTYMYPCVYTNKTCLVVSPLIALMNDQKMKLDQLGINSICLNSTISNRNIIKKEILENKYRLVYTTPEFIEKNESFIKQLIELDIINQFCLDEAHIVSSWSQTFRPAYQKLVCLREWGGVHIPILCLTATATLAVRNDIIRIMKLTNPLIVKSTFDRPNLVIKVTPKSLRPIDDLLSVIKPNEPTIVYCQTRQECDDLAFILTKNKIVSKAYHAGMNTVDRNAIHMEFAQGDLKCVVCTIAFGMGIDIVIRKVINYGIPSDMESYYQQIGRAGRDGLKSDCILFFRLSDMNTNNYHINQISNVVYRNRMMELTKAMKNYVFSSECRRKYILEYFSEEYKKPNCGACDNCFNKKEIVLQDFAKEAKQIFDTLTLLDGYFGSTMLILILRGSKNKQIKPKFTKSPLYGSLSNKKEAWLKNLITLLINDNFIKEHAIGGGNGFTVSNTKKSLDWVKAYNSNQNTQLNLEVPESMQEIQIQPKNKNITINTQELKQDKLEIDTEETKPVKSKLDKLELVYQLLNRNKSISEIAKQLEISTQTIEGYVATLYEKDYDLDLTKFGFTKQISDTIIKKIIELEYPKNTSTVKAALPNNITYLHIKLAITKMNKLDAQPIIQKPIIQKKLIQFDKFMTDIDNGVYDIKTTKH